MCRACGRRERAGAEVRLLCASSLRFLAFVNCLLAGPVPPLPMETVGDSLLWVTAPEAMGSQACRCQTQGSWAAGDTGRGHGTRAEDMGRVKGTRAEDMGRGRGRGQGQGAQAGRAVRGSAGARTWSAASFLQSETLGICRGLLGWRAFCRWRG